VFRNVRDPKRGSSVVWRGAGLVGLVSANDAHFSGVNGVITSSPTNRITSKITKPKGLLLFVVRKDFLVIHFF